MGQGNKELPSITFGGLVASTKELGNCDGTALVEVRVRCLLEMTELTKGEPETNLLYIQAGLWDSFESVLQNNWLYVFCKRFIY